MGGHCTIKDGFCTHCKEPISNKTPENVQQDDIHQKNIQQMLQHPILQMMQEWQHSPDKPLEKSADEFADQQSQGGLNTK